MSGFQKTGIWSPILLCVMLACGRPTSAGVPDELKDDQQSQPTGTTHAAKPTERGKPMRVGGEVSAPKPVTRLNIRWPANPTECYQLGVAVFAGVVDRTGKLRDVKLIKGPDNKYTQAAREAIERQEFEPAMYRGKPVDVIYHIAINHVPVKKVKGPC